MNAMAQTLEQALQLHRAGNLHQAELLYRQILAIDPQNADALHLFGVIANQVGRSDLAVEYIERAIRVRPEFPEALNNLGKALAAVGKMTEAADRFHEAIRLKPDYAKAHYNLGAVMAGQGRPAEAVDHYRQAVRFEPDYADAHYNLGLALKDQGLLEQAIAAFRHAARVQPSYADAHNNMGCALKDQGKTDEAIAAFQQALHYKPDYAEAHSNLGNALKDRGKLEEAIACHRQALRLKPDHAEAYNNLGNALKEMGQIEEAIANYRHALALKVDYAEACSNLGNALKDQGKFEEAIASHRQALRLKPAFADAHNNLADVLKDQGQLDEAITAYREALALKSEFANIHSNLVFILNYHPGCDSAALYQEARRWNDRYAEPHARFRQPHANDRDPRRRLRVGYVSPDFRLHPVANLLMPLLANHDHGQVEVYCYADLLRPDEMTTRLRGCADGWRDTVGLKDEQVAAMVRQDRIDILVDLALHTSNNRLLVFARKPAPVQLTWLGYPGTTGMSAIDYRLTDPYFDPPGEHDSDYAETSIRLPETVWCYDPAPDEAMVPVLPAMRNGFLTLGCLNNFCKVNDGLLALWARAMRSLPAAQLLMHAPPGSARDHVLAQLAHEGVAASRVQFVHRQSRAEYFEAYNRIDLCLDAWPCNGGVTSMDALWMGVPIITLVGKTAVGRAGWSLLNNVGLPELAARTPEEYIARTVTLARDLPRLQELRTGLRTVMRASPLMDGKRFAKHVQQAYRQMWQKWCAAAD